MASNVPGMGPGNTWVDSKVGSETPYRCDLLPPLALLAVARLRHEATEKYGEKGIDDWRQSDPRKHINKVIAHMLTGMAGDTTEGAPEEHYVHALCRLMFAVELHELQRLNMATAAEAIVERFSIQTVEPQEATNSTDNIAQAILDNFKVEYKTNVADRPHFTEIKHVVEKALRLTTGRL